MSLSIKPLCRANAVKKDGTVKIYIRVTINRVAKFKATDFELLAKNWNTKLNEVKPGEPLAASINLALSAVIQRMRKTAYDATFSNEPVTHSLLFSAIKFAENENFLQYALKEIKSKKVCNTRRLHLTGTANKLNDFKKGLSVAEITPQLLESFKKKLHVDGLAHNTIVSVMSHVKTIINAAARDKLIKDNPFDFVEVGSFKNGGDFLSSQELFSAIENSFKIIEPSHAEVLRRFLFCCCSAFRYGDAEALDYSALRKHQRGYYFLIEQQKTGDKTIVPLSNVALSFIDATKTEGRVFTSYTNQFINRTLKTVFAELGINRRITTHVARHTFVTVSQEKGMSMKLAGVIAGHKKESTTNTYSHYDLNSLFTGIEKWNS